MKKNTLISIGEALIDFIPSKTGCNFNDIDSFSPSVGGAPANVCGAFSKLGGKSIMLTQLGTDSFGIKIKDELSKYDIDTSYIKFTDKANTALAFVNLEKDGNRTFSFYRNPSADMLYNPEQIDKICFRNAFALHFCSVSLGNFPMKDSHITAIDYAKNAGALISFDPNLRFQLWKDKNELYRTVNEFIPKADILKISDEELEFISGEKDIEKALPKLFRGNVKLIIYTCGKDGAYAFTSENRAYAESESVSASDTTGAGDGFIGSFLWSLYDKGIDNESLQNISADELKECLKFSNKFCGLSVQNSGAIESYPSLNQMK